MQDSTVQQAFKRALEDHRAGRWVAAERGYRRILEQDPNHSDALNLLGVIALQTGNFGAALELIQRAVALRPDAALYYNNLGQVLERLRRDDEARAAYATAIRLDPQDAEPVNNMGQLLMRLGDLEAAEAHCRSALALAPEYAEPHTNLANVLKESGDIEAAVPHYRKAVELRPDLSFLHSNLLLALHYHPGYSPQDLAREHRAWAERHVAPLARERRPHANVREPERRLRIGYVSPDFREHSVARFIRPILGAHDRERFEVFAYADVSRPDAITAELRATTDVWRDVAVLGDAELADAVRADRIDILVDLAAHSGRNRLLAFARKPAPVQVTYLGYCSTTGVDAIDYRLTDRFLDPPGTDLTQYTERSMRLPDCYWCYRPPALAAPTDFDGGRRPGAPTFGCLNNFAKVTRATLELWARLMTKVPEARLLLHARPGAHRARAQALLARAGVEPSRVQFVGMQPLEEYLAVYREIDVALDPFPFGGGTTTCDTLWMGVPVVTLTGSTPVSRAGSTLLANAGLPELVAGTEEQYVEIAARLVRDQHALGELRRGLRARLEASPVMDLPRFTRNLEAAFRTMWRAWCAQP